MELDITLNTTNVFGGLHSFSMGDISFAEPWTGEGLFLQECDDDDDDDDDGGGGDGGGGDGGGDDGGGDDGGGDGDDDDDDDDEC